MRYRPWIISIYESAEDVQTLWRMFNTVSSVPLPMVLFVALSGYLAERR
jgi:hypothetical protein